MAVFYRSDGRSGGVWTHDPRSPRQVVIDWWKIKNLMLVRKSFLHISCAFCELCNTSKHVFLLFSIPNESPDSPELRPGYQKWWKTSKNFEKFNFSNLSGNHFYTSPVHSASSRHLKRCFSPVSISLHPIGSETAGHTLLVGRCP